MEIGIFPSALLKTNPSKECALRLLGECPRSDFLHLFLLPKLLEQLISLEKMGKISPLGFPELQEV